MGQAAPQNVLRSGMGSNDNPLNNTKAYYPNTKSAARGALSTAMHGNPSKGFGGDAIVDTIDKGAHAQYSRGGPA